MHPPVSYKVVIAEDQVMVAEGLSALLQLHSGFTVLATVKNGNELIHYLNGNKPDIVLLDLNMPVMDGWGFLETFVKKFIDRLPNIKVAITSAFLTDEEVARLEKYSMVIGYFPAPLCLDKLADMKQKLGRFSRKLEAVA